MNWIEIERLALLAELIGGIGMLATLVFLALEVRKNSRILRANAKTTGMQSFASYNEMVATDPVLPALFSRVFAGDDFDLFDPEERIRMTSALRGIIQRIEAEYFQYVEGLIDERYWTQRRTWLKRLLLLPNIAKWWAVEEKSLMETEEFIAHINSTETTLEMGLGDIVTGQRRDQGS